MFSFFDEMLIVFQKFKYQLLTLILCNCTKIYCIFLQLFQAGIIYLFNKKKKYSWNFIFGIPKKVKINWSVTKNFVINKDNHKTLINSTMCMGLLETCLLGRHWQNGWQQPQIPAWKCQRTYIRNQENLLIFTLSGWKV